MKTQQQYDLKLKIIMIFLDKFTRTTRCINDDGGCSYEQGDNRCAVSLFLTDDARSSAMQMEDKRIGSGIDSVYTSLHRRDPTAYPNLNALFQPEYQGLDLAFWENLQAAHDHADLWGLAGRKGMTSVGLDKLAGSFAAVDYGNDGVAFAQAAILAKHEELESEFAAQA